MELITITVFINSLFSTGIESQTVAADMLKIAVFLDIEISIVIQFVDELDASIIGRQFCKKLP